MDQDEREAIRDGRYGQQAGQVEQAVSELENALREGNETAAEAARGRLGGFGHTAGVDRKAAAAEVDRKAAAAERRAAARQATADKRGPKPPETGQRAPTAR